MRPMFLVCLALLTLSGCKTLELAVQHPTTGLHIFARVEGQEPVVSDPFPVMKRLPPPEYASIMR